MGAATGAYAADGMPVVVPGDTLFSVDFHNPRGVPLHSEVIETDHPEFDRALRVRTEEPTEEWWAVQLSLPTNVPVQEEDALLATFYLRAVDTRDETGEAYVRVFFQKDGPPYQKSLLTRCGAAREWRKFQLPFSAHADYGSGGAVFVFAFESGPQVIDIAGVEITNYGAVPVDSLPRTRLTYEGREADAPWRAAANARIDKLRKSDLKVTVKDAEGGVVEDARVTIRQTRHGFPFGTAVVVEAPNGQRWGENDEKDYWFTEEDDRNYDYWLDRWFTKVTPEVALMPKGWTGKWRHLGREVAMKGVKHYYDRGFEIRGHMLVWPGWEWFWLPGIEEAQDNPEVLGPMVIAHIKDETSAVADMVDEWTLLNEPFAHHDLMDVLGWDVIVEWFEAAHEANPDAELYINDYSILSGGGYDLGHQDHYAETIEFLIENDAPMHGIGLQGHFGEDVTPPERVYEILDRFAKYELPLQVTEFDVNTEDDDLQADYTRDFMTIVFSHPAITSINLWGFWANAHWRPSAALIDADWNVKPNGRAFDDLIRKEWWTEAEGETGDDGVFATRAFHGEYEITVVHEGNTMTRTVTLPSGGADVAIDLSEAAEPAAVN